ncbi:MAG TPA: hypothetical protein GXX39_00520 [Syntrophothermus lipocalidus]|nr:hypothetical protein [Syntrophothermus lipocalidus]
MGEQGRGFKTYKIFLGLIAFILVLGLGFVLGMRFEQGLAGEKTTTSVIENRKLPGSNGKSDSAQSKRDNTPTSVGMDVAREGGNSQASKDDALTEENERSVTVDLLKDLHPFTGEKTTAVVVSGVNYTLGYILREYSSSVRWNLDSKFNTVKLAVGVPDDAYSSNGRFDVLLDEETIGHYAVSKDGGLKEFTINVSGGRILVVSGSSNRVAIVKAVGEREE